MKMNLRRKIYSWYLLALIASIVLIYAVSYPVDMSVLIKTYMAILISTLPVVMFLEYGVFLRVERVNRAIKAEKKPRPILDYGHDEISDIAEYINGSMKNKTELEATLAASKEHVKNALDDAPILVQRFEPDGKLIYINNTYAKHFDIPDREKFVAEENVFEFLARKGYDFDLKKDLSVLTLRSPHSENVYKRRSQPGHMMWVNRAVFDSVGNIVEYQVIGVDITRTKQLEEKLTALTNNISTMVIWVDKNFAIRYVSDSVVEIQPLFKDENVDVKKALEGIRVGEVNLFDTLRECSDGDDRIEDIALIENKVKGFRWYNLTIKSLESGYMILLDDVTEEIQTREKLIKQDLMRDFTFNLISSITSCDLKDIKTAIQTFTKDVGAHLSADTVIVSLYDKENARLVARWDATKEDHHFETPPQFVLNSKWWNEKIEQHGGHYIFLKDLSEVSDIKVNNLLLSHNVKSVIAAPVSFNHTNIGTIFIESHKENDWCEIDALTVKMAGRLIGMALRPAVTKQRDGVRLDKKII